MSDKLIMNTSPGEASKSSFSAVGLVGPSITSLPGPSEPPSYPPTEVQRWLTCPVLYDYSKRWEPRTEVWTPHRAVGTAIHSGVAAFLREEIFYLEPAIEALQANYVQQETWGLAGLEALVTKGVRALIQAIKDKLLPGATILGVEHVIEVGGRHRILDLALGRASGLETYAEIWDWKTKIRLDEAYLPETQQATLHDWQLLDYAYHGEAVFGRPLSRVGQGLVILGPKLRVEFIKIDVTPERLDQAKRDAEIIWYLMSSGAIWHNWRACTDKHLHYGQICPFFQACHLYLGDESKFPALYQPIEADHAL